MDRQLRTKFENSLNNAESHLKSTEASARELSSRIKYVRNRIKECEVSVHESQLSIQNAEKSVSTLVKQQAQTKRKLSQLYNELISVTSRTNTETAGYHKVRATDNSGTVLWNVYMFNSFSSASGKYLLRHSFYYTSLHTSTLDTHHNIRFMPNASQQTNQTINPFVPLCPYALSDSCTDENCRMQHLTDYTISTDAEEPCYSSAQPKVAAVMGVVLYDKRCNDSECVSSGEVALRGWKYAAYRKHLQKIKDNMTAVTKSRQQSENTLPSISSLISSLPGESRSDNRYFSRSDMHDPAQGEGLGDGTLSLVESEGNESEDKNDTEGCDQTYGEDKMFEGLHSELGETVCPTGCFEWTHERCWQDHYAKHVAKTLRHVRDGANSSTRYEGRGNYFEEMKVVGSLLNSDLRSLDIVAVILNNAKTENSSSINLWRRLLSTGLCVLVSVMDVCSPEDMDESLCCAYIRHVELAAVELTPKDFAQQCLKILHKFDSSWRVHCALKAGGLRTSTSDRHIALRDFSPFSLTFAILSAAECMWQSCSADVACSFLAKIVQASDECPLKLTHFSGKCDHEVWDDSCLMHARGALFMDILPSDILKVLLPLHPHRPTATSDSTAENDDLNMYSSHSQHISPRVDASAVWASLLFALFTGDTLGTTMLINHHDCNFEFFPAVEWSVAVAKCRGLLKRSHYIVKSIADLLSACFEGVFATAELSITFDDTSQCSICVNAMHDVMFSSFGVCEDGNTAPGSYYPSSTTRATRHSVVQCIAWCTLLYAESLNALSSSVLVALFPIVPRHLLLNQKYLRDVWCRCCSDSQVLKVDSSECNVKAIEMSESLHIDICLPAKSYISIVSLGSSFLFGNLSIDAFIENMAHRLDSLIPHLSTLGVSYGECAGSSLVRILRHLLKLSAQPLSTNDYCRLLTESADVVVTSDDDANDMLFALHRDKVVCDIKMLMWLYAIISSRSLSVANGGHHILTDVVSTISTCRQGEVSVFYLNQFVPAYVLLWIRLKCMNVYSKQRAGEVIALLELLWLLTDNAMHAKNSELGLLWVDRYDDNGLVPPHDQCLFVSLLNILDEYELMTVDVIEYVLRRCVTGLAEAGSTNTAIVWVKTRFCLGEMSVALVLNQFQRIIFSHYAEYLRLCAMVSELGRAYVLTVSDGSPPDILSVDTLCTIATYAFDAEDFSVLEDLHRTMARISNPRSGFLNTYLLNTLTGYRKDTVNEDLWTYYHNHLGTTAQESLLCESCDLSELSTKSLLKIYSLHMESKKRSNEIGIADTMNHPENSISPGSLNSLNRASAAPPPFTAELSDCFQGDVPLCIAQLESLHSLVLSHNDISQFPMHILCLSNLVRLNLSWNKLAAIPKSIGLSLVKLQVLDLSHNSLTEFPKCILKIRSLIELYIQDNNIEEIRNDILLLEKLRHLDISNNRLKVIPPRLNQSLKLQYFRFSGNPLFDAIS